jgi:acyl-CoA hydrolase
MTVYAPGLAGESTEFVEALWAAPEAAAGVRFVGVWLPGYNHTDYAGLHREARSTAFFVYPELRASFAAGRVDYLPISYHAAYVHLRDAVTPDLALLHVSPPDRHGRVGLGVANDFTPAVLPKARLKVAHINPGMPRTHGTTIDLGDIDYVVTAPMPVAGSDFSRDRAFEAIGNHLAALIRDGDTLEVGIGHVPGVLSALAGHRQLSFHTGAITDSVLRLVTAGAVADRRNAITTGVAWGSPALYEFVADNPRVRFAPVGWTHDLCNLQSIQRFIAINAVLSVDLFGQANAEMIGGRQVSSAGGITDFMRGARLSSGGFSVIALPATAHNGMISRIVPQLDPGAVVSVSRQETQVVITEYGIADLRGRSVDERAEALIAVAAPEFRDELDAAWRARRARM